MRARRMPMSRWSAAATLASVLIGLITLQAARGDDPPPKTFELTLSPAAEPVPALRYHLLPPIEDQIPGNAVPIYLRILFERNEEWRRTLRNEPSRLLELSPNDFGVEEAGKLLARFEVGLDQLRAASLRSDSDWEYVVEGRDPLRVLLPDAQGTRDFVRLLALKARYEIRRGDFPAGVDSLRDGLALAQHLSRAPFLVNQLIGIANTDIMLYEIDDFVQQEGAMNLYWALAELPRPLISLRNGLASESRILKMRFPELGIHEATHDWQQLSDRMRLWAGEVAKEVAKTERGGGGKDAILALNGPLDAKRLAAARKELPKMANFSAEQVLPMSDAELTVRHTVALHRELSDSWRKWSYVPYPQSLSKFPTLADELGEEARRREIFPLLSLLSSYIGNVRIAQVKVDRQVARLQTIEALRMQAAATGKLPATLDEVTVVPVPLDPATGGPFAYTLDGETATLDVTDPAGMQREVLRMPVKLTLRSQNEKPVQR